MKKYGMLSLLIAVCVFLASCSGFGVNIDDSLSPPKPSGELYEIQKTLETAVGHDVNLVYPSAGEYRSAIITKDINFDGKYDVFSFYSTETDDKTTVMHINYIRWIENKWESVTDLQLDCSGVESVEFVKLDKSETPKVLVNWSRYSANSKYLSVYSIDTGELVEIAGADYSVYSACDFDSDGISEIVALHLDSEKSSATATLLALGDEGFSEKSTCRLDGTVTSYYTPVFSKFTDGTPALFVDAVKATGMITEILCVKDGELTSAIRMTANSENVNTLRASSVPSADYDKDGCIDIPLAIKLPIISTVEGDSAYLTAWNSFNGATFTPIAYTVINYTDGYYFNMPQNWLNTVTLERRLDLKMRVFYRWDPELQEVGEEIMSVMTVALKDWDSQRNLFEGYFECARSTEYAYCIKLGSSALNPGTDYFKDNFHLISNDEYTINRKP